MSETSEAWKCPECGNIQYDATDCENCDFGEDEEGWDTVQVIDKDGVLEEVE